MDKSQYNIVMSAGYTGNTSQYNLRGIYYLQMNMAPLKKYIYIYIDKVINRIRHVFSEKQVTINYISIVKSSLMPHYIMLNTKTLKG